MTWMNLFTYANFSVLLKYFLPALSITLFHVHTVKYTLVLLNWKEGTNLKYLQAG
jgi:hypothetical protein